MQESSYHLSYNDKKLMYVYEHEHFNFDQMNGHFPVRTI